MGSDRRCDWKKVVYDFWKGVRFLEVFWLKIDGWRVSSRVERITWGIQIKVEWFGLKVGYIIQFTCGCSVAEGE